jgi:hypothetical protein
MLKVATRTTLSSILDLIFRFDKLTGKEKDKQMPYVILHSPALFMEISSCCK